MSELNLLGFDELDPKELEIINRIIGNKLKKIDIKYNLLKIELKKHKHGTKITHEIKADLFPSSGKAISAQTSDDNLYRGMEETIKKIINEVKHKFKKK